jgi:hypothetical protein
LFLSEQVKGFGLADTAHGTKINKNGKEMLSLHIGLDVLCLFEAKVQQCLAAYTSFTLPCEARLVIQKVTLFFIKYSGLPC